MKYPEYQLYDCIGTEVTITCEKCGKEESIHEDEDGAIAILYQDGWRNKNGECHCPKCAKKKKK